MKFLLKVLLSIVLAVSTLFIVIVISFMVFVFTLDYSNGLQDICIAASIMLIGMLLLVLFKKEKVYSITILVIYLLVSTYLGYNGFKKFSAHG